MILSARVYLNGKEHHFEVGDGATEYIYAGVPDSADDIHAPELPAGLCIVGDGEERGKTRVFVNVPYECVFETWPHDGGSK